MKTERESEREGGREREKGWGRERGKEGERERGKEGERAGDGGGGGERSGRKAYTTKLETLRQAEVKTKTQRYRDTESDTDKFLMEREIMKLTDRK